MKKKGCRPRATSEDEKNGKYGKVRMTANRKKQKNKNKMQYCGANHEIRGNPSTSS
jgi:hypothetical protein